MVTAYIEDVDGSVINSNTVEIFCEPKLIVSPVTDFNAGVLDQRKPYSTDVNWYYKHLDDLSIMTNVISKFTFDISYVIQDQINSNSACMTLENTTSSQKYFTLTIETAGGQKKDITVYVNPN